MPVHNWNTIFAGAFHHFHQSWILEICRRLNSGLLPDGYYSAAEQVTGGRSPDVVTLEEEGDVFSRAPLSGEAGGLLLKEVPPRVQYEFEADAVTYAEKADRVAIRHVSENRVIAVIEIVSPGNKYSRREMKALQDTVYALLDARINLLLVDLILPGNFDPEGLPRGLAVVEDSVVPAVTAEQPLSLFSLRADPPLHSYIGLCSHNQPLPDMPLFLTPERYINIPLEETYLAAWQGVPGPWKRQLEAGGSA
ncbi:MAG: DUF4058 family protein [Planctomycetaceae bacterium]|nr:DUF4058 family protein [Planctomycetaceae bacterium]